MGQRPEEILKALSDETRLKMTAMLLERRELCVCDFEGALKIGQSKASRHLRYLRNAGLTEDRREGVWMHYRLRDDLDPPVEAVVAAAVALLPENERRALTRDLDLWFAEKARQGCSQPGCGGNTKEVASC